MLCIAFPRIEDIENLEIVDKLTQDDQEKYDMIGNYINTS